MDNTLDEQSDHNQEKDEMIPHVNRDIHLEEGDVIRVDIGVPANVYLESLTK